MEIVESFDKNTYRAVYTVKLGDVIYVLHCFQKKSQQGIKTPAPNMDLIKKRLQAVKDHIKGVLLWLISKHLAVMCMQT